MTGFFLCTSYFGIALKLHELSALNPFQYPIGILNRNVRGFLVCVSIMKREGNMASMPFLFDTWSGSLQWHRMIFFFLFYVVYFSFFIFFFLIAHSDSEKRQKKKLLLDYLYSNLKNHNFWAYRYFFCEFLGLVNIFGTYPSA